MEIDSVDCVPEINYVWVRIGIESSHQFVES